MADLTTALARFLGVLHGASVGIVQQVSVTLTDADIKALPTLSSPFGSVVVPAQGANTVIMPLVARLKATIVTGYTNLTSTPKIYGLSFGGDRFAMNRINSDVFELTSANRKVTLFPKGYIDGELQIESDGDSGTDINTPIVFSIFTADNTALTGGNAGNSLSIYMTYMVLDLSTGLFR